MLTEYSTPEKEQFISKLANLYPDSDTVTCASGYCMIKWIYRSDIIHIGLGLGQNPDIKKWVVSILGTFPVKTKTVSGKLDRSITFNTEEEAFSWFEKHDPRVFLPKFDSIFSKLYVLDSNLSTEIDLEINL